MNGTLFLLLALSALCIVQALYSKGTKVVQVSDEKTFKKEVQQHGGIVIVEFYAPWCGHCKTLAPEFDKAAKMLDGTVKLVAVDATVETAASIAQKYGVQGYPTLKVFGADKKTPTDFNGQRTADAIVSESMKLANKLVKDRKAGKCNQHPYQ
jgi:protein disulfide-isomerase A6